MEGWSDYNILTNHVRVILLTDRQINTDIAASDEPRWTMPSYMFRSLGTLEER